MTSDMTRRVAQLIINPISGTGDKSGLEETVVSRLGKTGIDVSVIHTTCRGDATRIAGEAARSGIDIVLAAGGDGTVNETASALCGTSTVLGILPCGSGNGLARHLGIPVDPIQALDVIVGGNIISADHGEVNGKKFFCTFGVGFDAAVSKQFAGRKRRGKLTYIRSTVEQYLKYRPEEYTIAVNGHQLTQKAFLVAVCNASQYGNNAYIAPHASITDGLLDVTIIHSGNPLQTALVGLDMMTGYINRNTLIQTVKASNLTITRKGPGPAHIDGEPVTIDPVMQIDCRPATLRVFTSKVEQPFKPIITPVRAMIDDLRIAISHFFPRIEDTLKIK